ncbi:MAG: CocE/NonD family hydrolase [Bacteroidales bacterium]|nr:CocE/NonD family hydrolase [Bacteroidales bacterium]
MKRIISKRIGFIIILLALTTGLGAQSISGDWYSLMNVQGLDMQFYIHIEENESGLTGTFDVPEQGARGIPLSSVSLKDQNFSFTFDPAGFSFEGISDRDYSQIIGYFKQGDMNIMTRFGREPVELPESSPGAIREIYNKEELYIEMRDGIKLFTSVYSPEDPSGESPILLFRTPYNAEGGGEDAFNHFVSIYHRFLKENYILVFQDVRGRYMSEGDFINVRPFIPNKKKDEVDEASRYI